MEWIQRQKEGLKRFWEGYGSKLFLGLCFLLVGVLCFEAGLLQKSLVEPKPMIIRVAEPAALPSLSEGQGETKQVLGEVKNTNPSSGVSGRGETCNFVGSKNSNKYHHPESRCAKQIKPENKRCFTSIEDAQSKGYIAGCLTP